MLGPLRREVAVAVAAGAEREPAFPAAVARTGLAAGSTGEQRVVHDYHAARVAAAADPRIDASGWRGQLAVGIRAPSRAADTPLGWDIRAAFRRHGVDVLSAFARFDRDGGSISSVEFGEGMEALGVGITGRQVEDLLALLDRDGDGSIDYREFASEFGLTKDNI